MHHSSIQLLFVGSGDKFNESPVAGQINELTRQMAKFPITPSRSRTTKCNLTIFALKQLLSFKEHTFIGVKIGLFYFYSLHDDIFVDPFKDKFHFSG